MSNIYGSTTSGKGNLVVPKQDSNIQNSQLLTFVGNTWVPYPHLRVGFCDCEKVWKRGPYPPPIAPLYPPIQEGIHTLVQRRQNKPPNIRTGTRVQPRYNTGTQCVETASVTRLRGAWSGTDPCKDLPTRVGTFPPFSLCACTGILSM